jgi:hypothetical protein
MGVDVTVVSAYVFHLCDWGVGETEEEQFRTDRAIQYK